MFFTFIFMVAAGVVGYLLGQRQNPGRTAPTYPTDPTEPTHGLDPFVTPTFIPIDEARLLRRRFEAYLTGPVNAGTVLGDPITIPDAVLAFGALFKLPGVVALRAYPILKEFGGEEKLSLVFTAIDSQGNNVYPPKKRTEQTPPPDDSRKPFDAPEVRSLTLNGGGELVENNNHPCKQPCSL